MPAPLDLPVDPEADTGRPAGGPATCGDFLAPFRAGLETVAPLLLDLAGTRIAIRANDPGLLAALAEAYWDFPGEDGPADIEVAVIEVEAPLPDWPDRRTPGVGVTDKECWIDLPDGRMVRKQRTGIRLVFGPAGQAVVGPCRRHLDQVVNAVNLRFMERHIEAGAILLHAAAVCDGPRGLAIAGPAGAGKSTLALELTRRGAAFVTNDRLLVAPGPAGPVMIGQPRTPRVNPGTLLANDQLSELLSEEDRLALSALSAAELRALEGKRDVPIHRCFGPGRFRLRADLAALVVLDWRPGAGPLAAAWTSLAARPDLAGLVQKDLGPLVRQGPRAARAADTLALLGDRPLLLLSAGVDFDRAAALCQAILAAETLAPPEAAP